MLELTHQQKNILKEQINLMRKILMDMEKNMPEEQKFMGSESHRIDSLLVDLYLKYVVGDE